MLQLEVANELKTFLPTDLHKWAIVAGGYAADPTKAADIDLWVVGIPVQEFLSTEHMIRRHVAAKGYISEHAVLDREGDRNLPGFPNMERVFYEEHQGQFRVVVDPANKLVDGKPVQIIITVQPNFSALLRSFDITTHQIGYSVENPDIPLRTSTYRTPLSQPRVTIWERPHQTLRRLERISKRYGFEPHPEDVKKLEALRDDANWKEAA